MEPNHWKFSTSIKGWDAYENEPSTVYLTFHFVLYNGLSRLEIKEGIFSLKKTSPVTLLKLKSRCTPSMLKVKSVFSH